MSQVLIKADREPLATDTAVIVSSDTHIGPRLVEDLRAYCPERHLAEFDEFAASVDMARARNPFPGPNRASGADDDPNSVADYAHNHQTAGHYDVDTRLRDMDYDGIVAEVIFHGSQNGEPLPFLSTAAAFGDMTDTSRELAQTSLHMYNQWLADVCSTQPERHAGLAQLPIWDVDACVTEVEWAREVGLRGVNFPAPRAGVTEYNDPAWEPFWSACEASGMPLTTHAGAGALSSYFGAETGALLTLESGGWPSRRALIRLTFAGVFERHPGLYLVLTEQPGEWWQYTIREFESAYLSHRRALAAQMPKSPSEYFATNVFIGGSFLSPAEAQGAIRDGYAANLMWGSDYPHMEGTWQYPLDWDAEPQTHQSLRYAMAGIPAVDKRRILADTAIKVYGLDRSALEAVATRIGAPTYGDLDRPLDAFPPKHGMFAFRSDGAWH